MPCDLPLPAELVRGVFETWRDSLVGIVAFGSVVRGEAAAGSDLDLLIVLERARRSNGASMIGGARWSPNGGSDAPTASLPSFVALPDSVETAGGLWLEVAREGRLVLDRDGRLARFLASRRTWRSSARSRGSSAEIESLPSTAARTSHRPTSTRRKTPARHAERPVGWSRSSPGRSNDAQRPIRFLIPNRAASTSEDPDYSSN